MSSLFKDHKELLQFVDLLQSGRLDEVFQCYSKAFSFGDEIDECRVAEIVSKLLSVEYARASAERTVLTTRDEEMGELASIFKCTVCQDLFHKPITLICGHTFCQDCLTDSKQESKQRSISCPGCGVHSTLDYSPNIVIRELMRNSFSKKMNLRISITEAEKLLGENKISEFFLHVERLMAIYPENDNLFCLRSKGFLYARCPQNALKDLEKACNINPTKSKAFFSRAEILSRRGDYGEAMKMYLRASVLKPHDTEYRDSLTLCLLELFRQICHVHVPSYEKNNLYCKSTERDDLRGQTPIFQACDQPSSDAEVLELQDTSSGKQDSSVKQDESKQARLTLEELQCKLCFNIIYEPVTTSCGHTFCRSCLYRCLDHRFYCPCCRTNLKNYLELITQGHWGNCEVLTKVLSTKFPEEYNARRISYQNDLKNLARARVDSNTAEIPICVCTLAVPDIAFPLHIFEAHHKLMIRRCLESGYRQFGMCLNDPGAEQGFATVGTILEIKDIEFLPDGRSIIQTIGTRRFKVLEKGTKDGYNTAKVEWLVDKSFDQSEHAQLCSEVYTLTTSWFSNLTDQQQLCIVQALGSIPSEELNTETNGPNWLWWLLEALPLNMEAKLIILSMTSVAERLRTAKRFLVLLLNRMCS